jgi:polyisoprenoid-binding protein YceI
MLGGYGSQMMPLLKFFLVGSALALLGATQAGQTAARIDTTHSKMTVFVYKEGIFAFAADNHEVTAPISSGSFDAATKTIDVKIDATKMQVQDPPSRRDKVQANMVGPDVLNVTKYPDITFHSTKIDTGFATRWTVHGDLTLHGQTHPIVFEVVRKDEAHFTGSAIVRQTEFGITPIKIAGGTVRVKDDVKVVFDIVLQ